ncbi:MAG: radical SAM protein, partial [Dictyoglomaceae bacterium]|nr:radical SAM protein [Dictyoglomaceae bacterium]
MYKLTKLKMHTVNWIFEKVFKYVANNYKKRIPQLINIVKSFSPNEGTDNIIRVVEENLDKNPAVQRLIHRVFTDYNPEYASKIFGLVILNVGFFWIYFNEFNRKKFDIATPYTILISPTMRCNLNCMGCYAGNYTRDDDLPYETVERIIKEGENIGCYLYTILGGEPFIYPKLL